MSGGLLNVVGEMLSPSGPATVGQVVTAICLGVRLEPNVLEKRISAQIAEADLLAEDKPNEMQRIIAADLGIAIDSKSTRGSVCMELLGIYHSDPISFATKPSRAFQDRFCGGPFERFGDWLPAHAKTDFKSQFPQVYEMLTTIGGLCLSLALVAAPFVAIWFALRALWNALFG